MILTRTRLKVILELLGDDAPAGFAEEAMAEFGPGSDWALGDKAKCPPDTWCEHCDVEYCNAGAPPLFEMLARKYFWKKGYDVVKCHSPSLDDDSIPF